MPSILANSFQESIFPRSVDADTTLASKLWCSQSLYLGMAALSLLSIAGYAHSAPTDLTADAWTVDGNAAAVTNAAAGNNLTNTTNANVTSVTVSGTGFVTNAAGHAINAGTGSIASIIVNGSGNGNVGISATGGGAIRDASVSSAVGMSITNSSATASTITSDNWTVNFSRTSGSGSFVYTQGNTAGTESGIVSSTGANNNAFAINLTGTATGTVALYNYNGTVSATTVNDVNFAAFGVTTFGAAGNITVVNGSAGGTGTIQAGGTANALWLRSQGGATSVTNTRGTITSTATGNAAVASNRATVTVVHDAVTAGNVTIANSGTISNTNAAGGGNAIYMYSSAVNTGQFDVTNNSGASITTATSGAAAIRVSAPRSGTIANSGTITGAGTTGAGGTAIAIDNSANTTQTTINLQSGSTTNGALKLGTGAVSQDIVNLNGGTLNGDIVAGGAGKGTVNVTVDTSTNGNIGTTNALNALNINGGILTLNNDVKAATTTNTATLAIAAGTTSTITGNYTQGATGKFKANVSGDSTYSKMVVTGTADLSASNAIDVNVTGTPLLTAGNVFGSVISAGILTSTSPLTVSDSNGLYDFTGVKNGNAVDLTVNAATGVAISGATNNIFTVTGALNGSVALAGTAVLNLETGSSDTGVITGAAGSVVNVNGAYTTGNTFNVGTFNIANGGTLSMGHGVTTASGFNNSGTLSVAAGTTSTITGNYNQATTGTFKTIVSGNTTYGKLVVSGTATLPTNAKINVNVANPNFSFTATSMAGIISAGTLTSDGTFAVTDNSALFDFTATKNGNAVDLALAVVSSGNSGGGSSSAITTSVTNKGNTPGRGAATVLDGLATAFAGSGTGNADMDTVMGAFGALTTNQELSDAVSQTLPLMTGGMAQATKANLNGVNRVVQARMEEHRGLSSGEGFVENGKGWFKPVGSWADQKNSDGAFGYTAETYGVVMGADGERSDVSRMGAAFGYTHSLVHGNSGAQSAKVDSYQFVAYGSRSMNEKMEYNWQADYAYNQNKGSRYISLVSRTAAADYTSNSLHIGTGIGKTIAWKEKTSFAPSIRADYTRIADGAYTETGANALNLVVAGKTSEELILSVDGKLAHSLSETSTLTANLGLGYDAMSNQNSITASYAGGGAAFTTNGINPSASLLRVGLGYVRNTENGIEITARYDAEARTGFTAQTVSAKLRMPF